MPWTQIKPTNVVLLVLAVCVLLDVLITNPRDEGEFFVSIGTFGALLSRGLLGDAQSIIVVLLGFALATEVLCGNHAVIDPLSGGWFLVTFLLASIYATWEKILSWLSL